MGIVTNEAPAKSEPGNATNPVQETPAVQHNFGAGTGHVKAETVDVARVGSSRQSPPSVDASKELEGLRREIEGLRKEKAKLKERLKRSDTEVKKSNEECASLQQRLLMSDAATEAANKQVQELKAMVGTMSHAIMSEIFN